jgi:hypothetical protein
MGPIDPPVFPPEGYRPEDDPAKDRRPRVNPETWTKPYVAPFPMWLLEALGAVANGEPKKKARTRKKAAAESNGEAKADAATSTATAAETAEPPEPAASPDGPIPEGHRNLTLTSMAGHMRKAGFDEDAIREALAAVNRTRCVPPLSDDEVSTIARSVSRYEADPFANFIFRGVTPPNGGHGTTATGAGSSEANGGGSTSNGAAAGGGTADSSTAEIVRIPASQLQAVAHADQWLWKGYLAKGSCTLLTAYWKAGKTVLLAHLLRALEKGGQFCGQDVARGRVVYVTEEAQGRWADRRDRLGLGDWCEFVVQPFLQKPSLNDWYRFINGLAASLRERPADLVVFDPLSNLWPVKDENSASETVAALMPLRLLNKETSCTLTLVHHLRKSDGDQATGSRGSGAIAAFADTIVELRRYQSTGKDRRRVLTVHSRFDDTPEPTVIELSEDGKSYTASGTRAGSRLEEAIAIILAMLPTTAPGIPRKELVAQWPEEDAAPRRETLLKVLDHGIEVGFWQRTGEGKCGSPYRYHRTSRPA